MTGLFYSKVHEFASSFECCRDLSTEEECGRFARSYTELMDEADKLLAFAFIYPRYWKIFWDNFFFDAISSNAHLRIDVAVSVMEERQKDFEFLRPVCKTLQFAEACTYVYNYKQYIVVRRKQQNHNNPLYVKDLTLYRHMDHRKLIELQQIKINQVEILGTVRELDENLLASVEGLSAFFGDLSRFDQGIADADAAFISGELQKYTASLNGVEEKLEKDLHEAMSHMMAVLSARLAEKITVLGMKIATNCNPLKLLFTGPDIADIAALANEVADAGADLAKGIALIAPLTELASDSENFANAFIGNSEQLSSVESLKNQILDGGSGNLNEDADISLQQYSAYTPQTDRSSLARNDALWSAFKNAACDLLFSDSGVVSAIPKGIAGAKPLCERLEGTLAQYFTLREDIFDFQFQLIDAIAAIIRANLAQRLAANIKGKGDVVTGAELLTITFLVQSDLQTVAATYCDVIEYKQLGKPFRGCATFQGLYRRENIDALVAYNPRSEMFHEIERFVSIPTRPSYPGNMAYIDLQSLSKNKKVMFRILKNKTWLHDNRWAFLAKGTPKFHLSKNSSYIYLRKVMNAGQYHALARWRSPSNPLQAASFLLLMKIREYLTFCRARVVRTSLPMRKIMKVVQERSQIHTVFARIFLSCVCCHLDTPEKMPYCQQFSLLGVAV